MTGALALWEQLADEMEAADPAVSRSTMMGLPCLRLDGAFFTSLDKRNGELIVKLSAEDVAARVADGRAHAFAPAGKVFREWAAVVGSDEETWRREIESAFTFARTK